VLKDGVFRCEKVFLDVKRCIGVLVIFLINNSQVQFLKSKRRKNRGAHSFPYDPIIDIIGLIR